MILVGDVGGTKTRFALYETSGGQLVRKEVKRYDSASASSFQELAKKFLSETGADGVETACFGVPGPVQKGHVQITNLPWTLSESDLKRDLNIPRVRLVNDLVAFTAAIPFFSRSDLAVLHEGKKERETSLACVLAPGTGLGMAFLHMIDAVPHPLASEGGHANFAPNNDLEIELLKFLKREFPVSVSYERLLCGPGLLNIYRFLRDTGFAKESSGVAERMKTELPAAVISNLATQKSDALCEKALDMFIAILGAHAGNLVLTFLATGGVYLGGGIAPKILEKLQDGTIVKSYLEKQRWSEVVDATPLYVIKDDQAALLGAAVLAKRLR
jgi:glucokinase